MGWLKTILLMKKCISATLEIREPPSNGNPVCGGILMAEIYQNC